MRKLERVPQAPGKRDPHDRWQLTSNEFYALGTACDD
jgi:hypothetical protein